MKLARRLCQWYLQAHRDLPWRRTQDPYRIWISEVMLQQTRATAVIPYYERFLARFPDIQTLAEAPEADLLQAWSGLGYYSRARNVQKAARQIAALGHFPNTYEAIRELPGVGDYTAAAVASIAFGLPHAVLDGNVIRVFARISNESGDVKQGSTRKRLQALAQQHLDPKSPATYNQALMELGATICVPRNPKCLLCPVQQDCQGRQQGRQNTLPIKGGPGEEILEERKLLWIESDAGVLLWQRPLDSPRLAGFWELPEAGDLPAAEDFTIFGQFRHNIVRHTYYISLYQAKLSSPAPGPFAYVSREEMRKMPLSTMTRKSLDLLQTKARPKRRERVK
jgi:A/G-specific adenine glycosylase